MCKYLTALLATLTLLCMNQQTHASGFALIEQSVSGMGTAYSGGAAIAEDPSTIYFNPAGITRLCGQQYVSGFHLIFPYASFSDEGSVINPGVIAAPTPPTGLTAPIALTGNNGGNATKPAQIGNFYYSRQLNRCMWFGLAATSPFGLVTDYEGGWTGRYHALHSQLKTFEVNPVLGYKINDCWSIGAGFRVLYAHAKLSNNVDYGSIAWLSDQTQASGAIQGGLNAAGFLPQTQDGHVELKGNGWGFGGNIGVLFEPCCGTRVGLNWRSQMLLKIKGNETFSSLPALVANPAAAGGLQPFFEEVQALAATNSDVRSDIDLPDLVQISVYHEINPCWAVMGDISWTRWRSLKELRFRFDNVSQADGVTTLNWKNTFRYSLGATYKPDCCWTLRSGFAYDQTPIPNAGFRTPRIPDEDRLWLACGVGYQWNQCLHFDLGYSHLFVRDPKINKSDFALAEDAVRGGLVGRYNAYTNIISAQLDWTF